MKSTRPIKRYYKKVFKKDIKKGNVERYCRKISPSKKISIAFFLFFFNNNNFLKMNWHNILSNLKHQHLKENTPNSYYASGGEKMKLKPYSDTTTNGLTNAIMDFLKFNKHYCNRINSMGVNRLIKGELKWTPSATRKGTADITAIINGKPCSIEVKCAATKDRMSEHQIKERQLVEASGGIYYVAVDMQSFIEWYYKTFKTDRVIV